jgi:hypothetical protein
MHSQPLAYTDLEFLDSDEARPIRILAEYLEPLRRFRAQNIQDTVVFFGSARIHSREAAEQALTVLVQRSGTVSGAEVEQQLARGRKAVEWSRYYEEARQLAKMLTEWAMTLDAPHERFVVTSGGGPGIMEAANRGAFDVGARSAGLNISLPHEQYPNPYITPELCFRFHYFALRKLHFVMRARALVVFPGGFGTMDELFEILSLSQTRKLDPVPIVLAGEAYWRQAFNPEFLRDEGVIDPEDRELFWYAESADDIWRGILRWYEKRGTPLLKDGASGCD